MIDALHVLYQETVVHLIRSRQDMKVDFPVLRGDMFDIGDLVLLKDHVKEKLKPQYNATYRIVKKIGDKTVDISDQTGKIRRATFSQLKKTTPMEAFISKIPINRRYGRQSKYLVSSLPDSLKAITNQNRVAVKQEAWMRSSGQTLTPGVNIPSQPATRTRARPVTKARKSPWRHRLRPRKAKIKKL